jgi:hypothetical protein
MRHSLIVSIAINLLYICIYVFMYVGVSKGSERRRVVGMNSNSYMSLSRQNGGNIARLKLSHYTQPI